MDVYIRTEDEVKGVWFCQCRPDELSALTETIAREGVCHEGELHHDVTFQFIYDQGQSGGELVIHTESDDG